MPLPEIVLQAWANRDPNAILATVDAHGMPNVIYVSNVKILDPERIAVVDNAFCKTRANLLAGSPLAFLFLTKEMKAYQIKGRAEYLTAGAEVEEARRWSNPKFPLLGLVIIHVGEVYGGAQRLA